MIIDTIVTRRVTALSDSAINVLLDACLFGHSPLCLGPSADDGTGIWRCQWCQAIDDRAIASRVFDGAFGHYREAPIYTIAEIVKELRDNHSKSTQRVYMLSLRAQIFGDTPRTIRRDPLDEETQLFINHTERRVGIAALTALGVVDEQGFVREDRW